jgi:hypothetical protein
LNEKNTSDQVLIIGIVLLVKVNILIQWLMTMEKNIKKKDT